MPFATQSVRNLPQRLRFNEASRCCSYRHATNGLTHNFQRLAEASWREHLTPEIGPYQIPKIRQHHAQIPLTPSYQMVPCVSHNSLGAHEIICSQHKIAIKVTLGVQTHGRHLRRRPRAATNSPTLKHPPLPLRLHHFEPMRRTPRGSNLEAKRGFVHLKLREYYAFCNWTAV